jgi:HEPN domain-containing protein
MPKIDKIQAKLKKLHQHHLDTPMQVPRDLQSIQWANVAIEYLVAAGILNQKDSHLLRPQLQLCGHALECCMKACVTSIGNPPATTHNLVQLYREIENLGFKLDERSQASLVLINHLYYQDLGTSSKFKLRYPTETSEAFGGSIPSYEEISSICDSLIRQAEQNVSENLALPAFVWMTPFLLGLFDPTFGS